MRSEKRTGKVVRVQEAYRRLRSSLLYLNRSDGMGTFVITSAHPGEGKSVTAANTALALAQGGSSVALLSADLRRPALEQLFAVSNDDGLNQWLAGDPSARPDVRVAPNLILVRSGPSAGDPGQLLTAQRFAELVGHYAAQADIVLVDTPPVLSTADAASISGAVDGVVVVVDSRRTDTPALLQLRGDVERAGGSLVGAVLNRTKPRRRGLFRRNDYYAYEKVESARSTRPHEVAA